MAVSKKKTQKIVLYKLQKTCRKDDKLKVRRANGL
jgi:hypothetical protein